MRIKLTKEFILENSYWSPEVTQQILQNQKLVELIEKEIPKCKKACEESIKTQKQTDYYQGLADGYGIILRLLEESKK